ncbi:parallel beta-helix repeat protein [Mucilaginibacter terrae]|uniref:Parallel beta-helix repeat protein n=1 Tax=Mucilaginibacter terrae TaxID=1955052 RepID=A0ABU3GN32_9SPHI|nr:parallel beta-helix repeat protein [Mucilaginibacter terrae]
MHLSVLLFTWASIACKKGTIEQQSTQTPEATRYKTTAIVNVPLGGNIQHAIDQVSASGGGTVNLASGTYNITSPLKIKSNVTLNGSGNATTTINGGNFNVIQQNNEGLTNVTIQNLKVTGVQSISCYGILIESLNIFHTNVAINNVQVTSVGMGVHLKRVNGVTITNCNFHDNAGPGKEMYFHNLYIRSCQNVNVSSTQVNHSTTGNGMNFSYCTSVTVSNCTANDNYFRGIRAADSDGFKVKDCTINGNGNVGLIMNQEAGLVTKNIELNHNIVNNNAKGGIQVLQGSTGSVVNNTATGNSLFNYSIASGITQSNNN